MAEFKVGDRVQFNQGAEIVRGTYEGAYNFPGSCAARVKGDDGESWLAMFNELSREAVASTRFPPQAQYSTLHREEFERWRKEQKADADGWIKWEGGECPVDPETMIVYRLRGYSYPVEEPEKAAPLDWSHHGKNCDIVAYRIVSQPEPQPYNYIPSAPVMLSEEQRQRLFQPRRDWQADFDASLRRAKLRRLAEQSDRLCAVTPSDEAGIARMPVQPEPVANPEPLPVSTTKAACVGLSVVWAGRGAPVVE